MRLQKDKVMHFYAGIALSLVAGLLYGLVRQYLPIWAKVNPALVGFVVAAIGGASKELIWDKWWKRGHPEWLDFWATALGGVIGSSVVWVLFKLLGR